MNLFFFIIAKLHYKEKQKLSKNNIKLSIFDKLLLKKEILHSIHPACFNKKALIRQVLLIVMCCGTKNAVQWCLRVQ
jgi:hypothetical protein